MSKLLLIVAVLIIFPLIAIVILSDQPVVQIAQKQASQILSTPKPTATPVPLPQSKMLDNAGYHVFQTFNNCGPAALSMALSFYGINVSQTDIGQDLRPWQNPQGDNDDKSTTLEELAAKSLEYDLVPYHRPNGSTEIVKQLIANDLPVIARTFTKTGEDIGHYRLIKGYDDTTKQFIQDDSLQGKNLRYTYNEFNTLWRPFNYEFLVLVPKNKTVLVENILEQNADYTSSWQLAVNNAQKQLNNNTNDIYARFNLSVALHNIGQDVQSVKEFEKVEDVLPFRTLWYQIEPIEAYYNLGEYERVFEITDKILNNHNKAFSEVYVIRGNIYKNQGNMESANKEYELARIYNKNLEF